MLVIAHRGASGAEPENTLRAFELAIAQGADMIELDLHLTRDNQVVVIHDSTLDHTTNLSGRVDQLTLAEVKRADAGKGERVPTLDETLDLTGGKVQLYLEIKDPRAASETLRIIRTRRFETEVMLASFDLALIKRLGEEVSDVELGIILDAENLSPIASQINCRVWSLENGLCSGDFAREIKSRGKKLYVWTVDEEEDFARMIDCNVDGIVTNQPDRLISYLHRAG